MSSSETVKNLSANGSVDIAMLGPARYMIAGTFATGTVVAEAYSKNLDTAVAFSTPISVTANTVFESNDPFIRFTMSGATGGEDVDISAIHIITRDRGI